ncbi:Sugar kinase of the NBD/HSP70 family, may contain an N-terminal HTH domain [Clostridium amylolyticum]|uniref:Sugar kinase of the NBD/HSP70 family, may contain an N-terminal HTH domain n=1 Tax=Clostridium amylolyticum TaxID=1121298 RepID=A0A1M6HAS5_9CLOT|nr:ROK family transcriptional regulator [Clostridium amylolyticum]SHJ19295.1 Sugar kinase of the NBD/HSP70 family, may contain an N-terminal HTH domain [Clostridium amylolyticum]
MTIGKNMQHLKQNNQKAVLNIINEKGSIPKKDMAAILGITATSITNITNEMIAEGILKTIGKKEDNKVGRKKVLISLNYDYKKVIGLNIHLIDGKIVVSVGITNLNATPIFEDKYIYDKDIDINLMFKSICEEIKKAMKEKILEEKDIIGIGVAIIGIVDTVNGISINPQGLWNSPVNVREIIKTHFNLPVHVINNIHSYVLAHQMLEKNLINKENFIFIKYGPRIGSVVVINGNVYEGMNNRAGKLSHLRVNSPSVIQCRCGDINCLEAVVSFERILHELKEVITEENMPLLFQRIDGNKDKLTMEDVYWSYDQRDPNVVEIINEKYYYIASILVNIIKFIDPNGIFLTGEGFSNENINKVFYKNVYELSNKRFSKEMFYKSDIDKYPIYTGAIALVLSNEFYN